MDSLPAGQGPPDGDGLTLRDQPAAPLVVEPQPGRPGRAWVLSLAILAAALGGGYLYFVSRPTSAPVAPQATSAAPAADEGARPPAGPLGGQVTPIDLPPLDESDAAIRALVKALSSHPQVGAWLATDGLIRNFTVVVTNIAEGRTPSRHLPSLRPSSVFQVTDGPGGLVGAPRNYRRYDGIAAAVASLDPTDAARLYGSIKPRIEEAYRELGLGDAPFDRVLERAIVVLLDTPAPDPTARLVRAPKGIGYRFAAPGMEALSDAQKQLQRAGPANAQTIQSWLRTVANALGISPERLPTRQP